MVTISYMNTLVFKVLLGSGMRQRLVEFMLLSLWVAEAAKGAVSLLELYSSGPIRACLV